MKRRSILKNLALSIPIVGNVGSQMDNPTIEKPKKNNFKYCLNTSTIMKQKVGLKKEIEIAAKAGFDCIEVWIPTIESYIKEGGKLSEIKKIASDLNISIENSIGFAKWIVEDEAIRNSALDQLRKELEWLSEIGCKRFAAPPFGATQGEKIDLQKVAQRFKLVSDLSASYKIKPQLELWGFSNNLHLLGETLFVLAESGLNDALLLPDVYHLYRGGSPFSSLEYIPSGHIEMFHMNDIPANTEPKTFTDAMRVLPGDGVAPFKQILNILKTKGDSIILSLEIFNEDVYKMDAYEACKLGLKKMKEVVLQSS